MKLSKILMACAFVGMTSGAFALTNGDFEAGTTGWLSFSMQSGAGLTSVAGTRSGGSGTLVARCVNDDGPASLYQTETLVDSGETWQLTGWVNIVVPGTGDGSFGWFGSVSPYNPGPGNQAVLNATVGWTQYTASQAMTSGTDGYRDAQVNLSTGPSEYLMDDFIATDVTADVKDWALF